MSFRYTKWACFAKGLLAQPYVFPVAIGSTSATQTDLGTAITLKGGHAQALHRDSIAIAIDGDYPNATAQNHGIAIALGVAGKVRVGRYGFALFHPPTAVIGRPTRVEGSDDSFVVSTQNRSYVSAGSDSVARGGCESHVKVGQNSRIEIEWLDPVNFRKELRVAYTYPEGTLTHPSTYLLPYVWYTLDPKTGEFIVGNGPPENPCKEFP